MSKQDLSKELWAHQNTDVSRRIQKGMQDAQEGRVTKVKNVKKFLRDL